MKERPKILPGVTLKVKTECGNLFVTVNFDENKKPFEVFAYLGKSGSCFSCQINSLCKVISIALRNGAPIEDIINHLEGMRCYNITYTDGQQYLSCIDALVKLLKESLEIIASRKI